MNTAPLLRVEKLRKSYVSGASELVVFRDLFLEVAVGEQVAVIGESGAGKSTLLHLISGLDQPTSGSIYYNSRNITEFAQVALSDFRNREIGYVWQQHHLLPEFTAFENVMMPLLIRNEPRPGAMKAAKQKLAEVGLEDRGSHRAGELSGGEQQRVAIARALVASPKLFLADEPTGNLDEKTGQNIFDLFEVLRARYQLTTILVTHNLAFARRCDRILQLEKGALYAI